MFQDVFYMASCKRASFFLMLITMLFFGGYAKAMYGNPGHANPDDPDLSENEHPQQKSGWAALPLPAISYNSDEGLQLGLFVNVYNYGDGSLYPDYLHLFSAQACFYIKGSNLFYFNYDSKHLIPGIRTGVNAAYATDKLLGFYGFNGYASPFDPDMESKFYTLDRRMLRVMVNFQGPVAGSFKWAAGATLYDFKIRPTQQYGGKTLYSLYAQNGIIGPDEKNGGTHIEFRGGFSYDTRDSEFDPSKGIYAEGLLLGSPDFLNRDHDFSYIKAALSFRQFVPLSGNRLTFGYHINYQTRLLGDIPYYMLPIYSMIQLRNTNPAMLGGGNTLRGVNMSRVVSNGLAWVNVELRWKFTEFRLLRQDIQLDLVPFFDAGGSFSPFRLEEMKAANDPLIWNGGREGLHMSAGLGLRIVMNKNFVVSADCGIPFDRRDGKLGVYFTMNHLF